MSREGGGGGGGGSSPMHHEILKISPGLIFAQHAFFSVPYLWMGGGGGGGGGGII